MSWSATGRANRRSWIAFGALLGACLLVAGCATVPLFTRPEAVPGGGTGEQTGAVVEPPRNADQFSIVRGFVAASANPEGDYANARGYLDPRARAGWNPGASVRVVEDTVDTLPSGVRSNDPRDSVVDVRANLVGELRPDGSFVPSAEQIREPVQVRRDSEGQWRIVAPSNGVLIKASDFKSFYTPMRVYFHDPSLGIPVPDLRWVRSERGNEQQVRQVLDLLLAGPSRALQGAVRTSIPGPTASATTVRTGPDGSLVINMSQLGELTTTSRRLIAMQVLRSLENVSFRPLRLQAYGEPMLPGQPLLDGGDLPGNRELVEPPGTNPGLVAVEGAVRRLDNGLPVPGDAGSGAYRVLSAAQSTDRKMLAMVSEQQDRAGLRIGPYGGEASRVDLNDPRTLTRPSWGPRAAGDGARSEVWTVGNGRTVYRTVGGGGEPWQVQRVDAGELRRFGKITELRLSRDGVRVAAVVDGQLVIGAVNREPDKTSISEVFRLGVGNMTNVVDVDWSEQDAVVVATSSEVVPVVRVVVDGLQDERYDRSNLTPPVTAVTSAPDAPIVVADQNRMWNYDNVSQGWRPLDYRPGPNVVPFYPG